MPIDTQEVEPKINNGELEVEPEIEPEIDLLWSVVKNLVLPDVQKLSPPEPPVILTTVAVPSS